MEKMPKDLRDIPSRKPTSTVLVPQMAPTPRPWHIVPNTLGSIEAEDGTPIAQAQQTKGNEREEKHATRLANAELICRAVNLFNDLLSVAKEAREHLARSRTTRLSATPEARHAFVQRMEAAISKAEAPSVPSENENHLAAPVIP